ncbi:hypothetical protein BSKO_05580 [Bryopsis sp. KO-2023]|nr:hypothetical protein BSKO_05580 [Bryopsis sp. KO-2023]
MKAAIILSTLALAVVLCSAGGGGYHGGHHGGKGGKGKHHKSVTIVEVDPLLSGFDHDGFSFQTFGGLQYSYVFHGSNGKGNFAAGTVIEQGDRCGLKGLFSCGNSCGSEDPVCKAVFTKCGKNKCRSNEVCIDGTCHEYGCHDGYKCFQGARRVCGNKCHTAVKNVCREERVHVCGNGVGGGRRLAGSGYNTQSSGSNGAWGHGSGNGNGAWGHGGVVNGGVGGVNGGIVGFFDPANDGFGFGHGGCGFITREVCEEQPYELCEEVCALKEGFHCTEETCGSDPEMVACGRGYCRLGDMCYQPSCDHACGYNKKYFCW